MYEVHTSQFLPQNTETPIVQSEQINIQSVCCQTGLLKKDIAPRDQNYVITGLLIPMCDEYNFNVRIRIRIYSG